MKKFLFLMLLFGITIDSYSQTICNCRTALENVIDKIEGEYPGFDEKTKDTLLYNSLKRQLIVESKKTDDSLCLEVLTKYTSFFRDKHIWMLPNNNPQTTNKKIPKGVIDIDLGKFYKKARNSSDELEGVWQYQDSKVGIIKLGKRKYQGFIIEADSTYGKPKEIKFILNEDKSVDYYFPYQVYKSSYKLYDDKILYISPLKIAFIKQEEKQQLNPVELQKKIDELDGFYVRQLTPNTNLIRISSFNYLYVDRIETLIEENRNLIENGDNLIIDIRDNGGGTDNAYKELLPFIVTNPIRNIHTQKLSTQGLIDGVTKYKEGLAEKDPEGNKSEIKELDSLISIYKKNIGEFINLKSNSVEIDTLKQADKSPKQIVILVNKHVGSAAENFLLKAKQSKKVKVLGIPTSGVLDYANAYFFKFGCDNYRLLLPTDRSLRLPDYPIDNIGIQPDIYMDNSVKDWVEHAVEYLEYE